MAATRGPAAASAAPLAPPPVIRLPPEHPPVLSVLVDVEEEFDWVTGFRRENRSVTHMADIERGHEVFDPFGIKPIFVVDHPVADDPAAAARLGRLAAEGRCEIGAHLHPWVTPPYDEQVGDHSSFPGNLPPELEAAKLASLADALEEHVGVRPRVYQAGRYGLGPHTAGILEQQGFEVDLSAAPPFDYAGEHGPDYSDWAPEPYWFGDRRRLLGLPMTGAWVGFAGGASAPLHRVARHPLGLALHLPGILSRLGAVDRLRLSPEGFSVGDMRRLTDALLRRGVRSFALSFHSPSLVPGHTEYVRTADDLARFLDTCREFFSYFFRELGGVTMTALELKSHLEEHAAS